MTTKQSLAESARRRVKDAASEINHSIRVIQQGHAGNAENDPQRRADVIQARIQDDPEAARALYGADMLVRDAGGTRLSSRGSEKVQGQTVDFVDVAFLERGMRAARSVCRLITQNGQAIGTGFLISPQLLLTNNHVIGSASAAQQMQAEFFYERDANGNPKVVTRYSLAPQLCFLTVPQDDLDFTVVAIAEHTMGDAELSTFGFLPLSPARNKHQLGDFANIIQHPDGRMKEAVIRENRIVSRPKSGTVLHYVTDTEPGASGSPVFNTLWDVIALHHWGEPHRELIDEKGVRVPRTVNEGIRTSAIVLSLETSKGRLSAEARALVDSALKLGIDDQKSTDESTELAIPKPPATMDRNPFVATMSPDGTATWCLPLTVAIRFGAMPPAPAGVQLVAAPVPPPVKVLPAAEASRLRLEIDDDYANRDGYDPSFLGTVIVPMPKLSRANAGLAAKNREPQAGDLPYVLRYQHFSAVMNGRRRLAFFTATNIDGKQAKNVNRSSGEITDLRDDEEEESLEGAEGAELWFTDRRIEDKEQTPSDLYQDQTTYTADGQTITDRRSGDHRNRMFQQGHLTRRQDPCWGCDTCDQIILRAHADTFHVTNRAPQVGYFNMGTRKANAEARHAGGNLHWRALEEYVLANAIADKQRVSVFTGPIFDDQNDYPWSRGRGDMRGFKAPREFWKLVLRVEQGQLKATALIADQAPLIDVLPEALFDTSAEDLAGFAYSKVARYHVAVELLQDRTGLVFEKQVIDADTFRGPRNGSRERLVTSVDEVVGTNGSANRRGNNRRSRPK